VDEAAEAGHLEEEQTNKETNNPSSL